MIAGMSTKWLRPHPVTVGMRQHVASRSNPVMSRQVAKLVTAGLVAALFVVFTLSQLMHWYILSSANNLDNLQAVRRSMGSENIGLLAKRAQLASKEYVVEQAGAKFQLTLPGKHQVNRL